MARILLVEDDEALRRMLQRALERAGHRVFVARDGLEAEQVFDLQKVDLVVTDLIMPQQEGLETILHIRKQAPVLPIIAMSGGGRGHAGDYLRLALHLGANRTLEKPFPIQELQKVVTELLDGERADGEP